MFEYCHPLAHSFLKPELGWSVRRLWTQRRARSAILDSESVKSRPSPPTSSRSPDFNSTTMRQQFSTGWLVESTPGRSHASARSTQGAYDAKANNNRFLAATVSFFGLVGRMTRRMVAGSKDVNTITIYTVRPDTFTNRMFRIYT